MLRLHNESTNGREPIVHEIAAQCAASTLLRIGAAGNTMSAAELRGYVRALARPWIAAEVERLQSAGLIARNHRKNLIAVALEQTVYLATRACASAPVVAMPIPHIRLRAAA